MLRVRRMMAAWLILLGVIALPLPAAEGLHVAFGEIDITPELREGAPVWLAGYGPGRQATGVHDPLHARGLVLESNARKIALVSVDSIGLQYPLVQQIRQQLPDYELVVVSSTHNHEAPDVIGIWGKTPVHRGTDDRYLARLVKSCVELVRGAEKQLAPTTVSFGTAEDETLLNDSRLPIVKDGVLRVLKFASPNSSALQGIMMQWNCHPEALGSANTLITADFVGPTVDYMKARFGCPVAYFTGTVGGLMAPPHDRIRNAQGELLKEGDFEFAKRYGEEVGRLAERALNDAVAIELTPFRVARTELAVPVTNPWYRAARALGVLRRSGQVWTGDPFQFGEPLTPANAMKPMAVITEVAALQLGALRIACIPGEIYPELIYGRFQDPADPNADFPDAPLEPTVAQAMGDRPWMILGLANDEVGYLIPKRQWDLDAPYAYGRQRAQYGEINSCGPDAAPIVMQALCRCARQLDTP